MGIRKANPVAHVYTAWKCLNQVLNTFPLEYMKLHRSSPTLLHIRKRTVLIAQLLKSVSGNGHQGEESGAAASRAYLCLHLITSGKQSGDCV